MAAPRTIRVARSLKEAGFEAWTPIAEDVRRIPRSKAFRTVEIPLIPSIVFAPYMDVPVLLGLLAEPVQRHPQFKVFRHAGVYPKVPDWQLDALREIERNVAETALMRAKRMKPRPLFNKGQEVRTPDGPFAGLVGEVIKPGQGKADLVLVTFPELSLPVKIASWHLERVCDTGTHPEHGTAAKAA